MAKLPVLPLLPDAYLADTADLSASEHGIYLVMMMLSWRRPDCALPDDMRWLKRSLQTCIRDLHGNALNAAVPKLLSRFWTLEPDGKWHDKRLGKERDSLRNLSKKQSDLAKKRWAKVREKKALDDAIAMPAGTAMASAKPTLSASLFGEGWSGGEVTPARASKRPTKASRLPADWALTDERLAEADSAGLTAAQARDQHARFCDYWRGAPGSKGVKADWPGTWRNWCRKTADTLAQQRGNGSAPPSRRKPTRDIFELQRQGIDPYSTEDEDAVRKHGPSEVH